MTGYTVVWLDDALDDLTEIWLNASDRNAVSTATADVDQSLAVDPAERGTCVTEDLWKFDSSPLRVYFTIRTDDHVVEVSNVVTLKPQSE